jgi:hypothetical protein
MGGNPPLPQRQPSREACVLQSTTGRPAARERTERQLNQPLRVATSTFLATLDSPIANFSGTTTRLGSLSIAVNSRSLVP